MTRTAPTPSAGLVDRPRHQLGAGPDDYAGAGPGLRLHPAGPEPNKGVIGDRVWLDINGDGVQNASEPGIEGVTVSCCDSVGNVVAVTTTDENGYYYFGNLSPAPTRWS